MYDEEDIVEILSKNHKSTMGVLKERQRYLNIIQTLWTNKNFKVRNEYLHNTNYNFIILTILISYYRLIS